MVRRGCVVLEEEPERLQAFVGASEVRGEARVTGGRAQGLAPPPEEHQPQQRNRQVCGDEGHIQHRKGRVLASTAAYTCVDAHVPPTRDLDTVQRLEVKEWLRRDTAS